MGQLTYGPTRIVDIDDTVLGHVEAAIISKLRRGEAFAFRPDESTTLWINAASQLEFSYAAERPAIERAWLEAMVETANTPAGMRLVDRP
jgi:hypothetical protein